MPPAPSTIDLHSHTLRSDGLLQPRALVDAAAAVGVRLLAITDHDDVSAYRTLTAPGAPDLPSGLTLLPGVEINCLGGHLPALSEHEIHVLGLGIDPQDDAFEALLAEQRGARRVRFEQTLLRLRELDLAVDDLAAALEPGQIAALGRPTIARLLQAKGIVTSVEDAFARYLGRGKPAYVPRQGIGPTAAIRAIRAAGGLPVLAHFGEAGEQIEIVQELREHGLGGLEVYYLGFDRVTIATVGDVARTLSLVPTGGSDYHGDTGSYADLHAALWLPPDVGERLLRALRAKTDPIRFRTT